MISLTEFSKRGGQSTSRKKKIAARKNLEKAQRALRRLRKENYKTKK